MQVVFWFDAEIKLIFLLLNFESEIWTFFGHNISTNPR